MKTRDEQIQDLQQQMLEVAAFRKNPNPAPSNRMDGKLEKLQQSKNSILEEMQRCQEQANAWSAKIQDKDEGVARVGFEKMMRTLVEEDIVPALRECQVK